MSLLTRRDKKYKKILHDNIRKLTSFSTKEIADRLGIRYENVIQGTSSIDNLEKYLDEYIYAILKEIILIESDVSYHKKIYYGGKSKDEQHKTSSL